MELNNEIDLENVEPVFRADYGDADIPMSEINENLFRVQFGMELTRPLKILEKYCQFKERYMRFFEECEYKKIQEEKREIRREYGNRPEVRQKHREWSKKNKEKIRLNKLKNQARRVLEIIELEMEFGYGNKKT